MNDTSNVLSLFQDAVDCIPCHDKQAYLDALECAPDVVAEETDPFDYMLFDNFNAWQAVNRIIQYWEWKKRLFGDRMFLPLHDLSGSGALNEEDLAVLWTGYVANLPKQKEGMSVILLDRTRLNQEWNTMDPKRNLRLYIFAMSLAAKEHKFSSNSRSLIIVNIIGGASIPNSKNKHNFRDMALVLQAVPISINYIRTIMITCISYADFYVKLVIPALEKNRQALMINFKHTMDLVASAHCVINKLCEYNLVSYAVPSNLGGDWDYSEYFQRLTLLSIPRSDYVNEFAVSHSESKQLVGLAMGNQVVHDDLEILKVKSAHTYDSNSKGSETLVSNTYSTGVSLSPNFGNNDASSRSVFINPIEKYLPHLSSSNKGDGEYLVHQSMLLCFLWHSHFDIQSACQHLGKYWDMREILFSEKAFLPMIQCEGGPLCIEDAFTLNSGFAMICPNDKMGNFVLVFEPRKAVSHSKCSQRRCFFYLLNVLIEQMITGKEKLVILFLFSGMSVEKMDCVASFADIGDSFPLEISFLHVFVEPGGLGLLACKLETLFNVSKDRRKIYTLNGIFDESLSVLYGLQPHNLPVSIGGLFDMKDFHLWRNRRSIIEWKRQARKKELGCRFEVQSATSLELNAPRTKSMEPNLLPELDGSSPSIPSDGAQRLRILSENSSKSDTGGTLSRRNEIDDISDFSNDDDSTLFSINTQIFN